MSQDITYNKKYIKIAAVIIVSMLYVNFLIKPSISKLLDLKSKEKSLKSNMMDMQTQLRAIDGYSKKIETLKNEGKAFERNLINSKDVPNFVSKFSNIAKKLDVKIIGIKPLVVASEAASKKQPKRLYEILPFQIEALGGFHQAGALINELENMDEFIKLVSLNIEEDDSSPSMHKIRLIFVSFAPKEMVQ
ncbi:MAG: type 4a pilus biogenesis protein PilO [Candidatus Omnitrophota bacterium]